MRIDLRKGDCVSKMQAIPEGTIDAVVCDPPYGIEFMGQAWDDIAGVRKANRGSLTEMVNANGKPKFRTKAPAFNLSKENAVRMQEWHEGWLREVYRILQPGGQVKAFSGSRTYHRLAAAMKDTGFNDITLESWGYGTGFPKSLDVSKQIDRRSGTGNRAEFYAHLKSQREKAGLSCVEVSEIVTGTKTGSCWNWEHYSLPEPKFWHKLQSLLDLDSCWEPMIMGTERDVIIERTMIQGGGSALELRMGERREVEANITAPATPEAAAWEGWGTALKPSWEPILIATK